MKQKEYRGYTIKTTSRQDPPGKWRATWSAVKTGGAETESKSGRVTKFFRTESDADEAALLAACSWVNAYGKR